jgi:hypothetical protein
MGGFAKTAIEEIRIPDTCAEIDSGAFQQCAGLRCVDFGRAVAFRASFAASILFRMYRVQMLRIGGEVFDRARPCGHGLPLRPFWGVSWRKEKGEKGRGVFVHAGARSVRDLRETLEDIDAGWGVF